MVRREFLCRATVWGVQCLIACCSVVCGTLFYSERCGRPHGGRIDWKIAALDGLGLILFFIPGVIAFVVDFSTGAIYLPEYEQTFPEYIPTPQEPTPAMSYEQTGAAATGRSAGHWVSAPKLEQPLPIGQVG